MSNRKLNLDTLNVKKINIVSHIYQNGKKKYLLDMDDYDNNGIKTGNDHLAIRTEKGKEKTDNADATDGKPLSDAVGGVQKMDADLMINESLQIGIDERNMNVPTRRKNSEDEYIVNTNKAGNPGKIIFTRDASGGFYSFFGYAQDASSGTWQWLNLGNPGVATASNLWNTNLTATPPAAYVNDINIGIDVSGNHPQHQLSIGNFGINCVDNLCTELTQNAKFDNKYETLNNGYASMIRLGGGACEEVDYADSYISFHTSDINVTGSNKTLPTEFASAAKMIIDASGNVGIGIIAPTQRLDVSGNVKISNKLDVSDVDISNNLLVNGKIDVSRVYITNDLSVGGDIRTTRLMHNLFWDGTKYQATDPPSKGSLIQFVDKTSNIDNCGNMIFSVTNPSGNDGDVSMNDIMIINRGGVNIYDDVSGNQESAGLRENAVHALNVYGSLYIDKHLVVKNNSGNHNANIQTGFLHQDENGLEWRDLSGALGYVWSKSGNDIYRNTGNVGIGTNNPQATLDVSGTLNVIGNISCNTGNVGIGTNDPQATLDVCGNTTITGTLNVIGNISCNTGNVGIGTNDPQATLDVCGNTTITGTLNVIGNISCNTGNVGIGTDDPQATLDVSGNVKISGNITANNLALFILPTFRLEFHDDLKRLFSGGNTTSLVVTNMGKALGAGDNGTTSEYRLGKSTMALYRQLVPLDGNPSFPEYDGTNAVSIVCRENGGYILLNTGRIMTFGSDGNALAGAVWYSWENGLGGAYTTPEIGTLPRYVATTNPPSYNHSNAISIAAGRNSGYALLNSGKVVAWGKNDKGQLGNQSSSPVNSPIKMKEDSEFGVDYKVGYTGTNAKQIYSSSCSKHFLMITNEGKVLGTGDNDAFQLGKNISQHTGVQDHTDPNYRYRLTSVVVQYSSYDETNAVACACGKDHSLMLLSTGTVVAFGSNAFGQLGRPTWPDNGNLFAAGDVVKNGGYDGKNAVSIAASQFSTFILLNTGKVLSCGPVTASPVWSDAYPILGDVSHGGGYDGTNAIAINCGWNHYFILLNTGKLVSWGLNASGQLGINTTNNPSSPTEVFASNGYNKRNINYDNFSPANILDSLVVRGNNVGIRTSTPSEALDVSGNVKISGQLNVDNNVGIRTSTPSEALDVSGNVKISGQLNVDNDVINYISNASFNNSYDNSVISHRNFATSTLIPHLTFMSTGMTIVNGSAGLTLGNNGAKIKIFGNTNWDPEPAGFISMGYGADSNTPICPVHIFGHNGYNEPDAGVHPPTAANNAWVTTNPGSGRWYDFNMGTESDLVTNATTTNERNVGLKVEHTIWTPVGLAVTSDRRVKQNIVEVNDELALQQLRAIEVMSYDYIDKNKYGGGTTIGFISQQVKEIMPMAVQIQGDYLPDEMREVEVVFEIFETTDEEGKPITKYKFAIDDLSGIKYKFKMLSEEKVITMDLRKYEDGKFVCDKIYEKVFLYGKWTNDFHILSKEKLFTCNFAATQEIDRRQQAEKTKLEAAETKLEAAETKLEEQTTKLEAAEAKIVALEVENTTLKTRLDTIEARLAALE